MVEADAGEFCPLSPPTSPRALEHAAFSSAMPSAMAARTSATSAVVSAVTVHNNDDARNRAQTQQRYATVALSNEPQGATDAAPPPRLHQALHAAAPSKALTDALQVKLTQEVKFKPPVNGTSLTLGATGWPSGIAQLSTYNAATAAGASALLGAPRTSTTGHGGGGVAGHAGGAAAAYARHLEQLGVRATHMAATTAAVIA